MQNKTKEKYSKSRFKGVHWHIQANKWQARIYINNKYHSLGLFISEEEAGLAYNQKAKVVFGEYALLNKIL